MEATNHPTPELLSESALAEIEARANAATEGPWGHFYPAARDFAHYGVIRPPNFKKEQDGVTVDAAPASGIRYQVEGLAKVNGADRSAIAYTSEPKSRGHLSIDPKERAFKLAHSQCERDGEFIAHARTDIPALCATVRAAWAQKFVAEDLLHVATESLRKSESTNTTLRDQLAELQRRNDTQAESIMEFQAGEKSLRAQLVQVEQERESILRSDFILRDRLTQAQETLKSLKNCQNKPVCGHCNALLRAAVKGQP